MGGNSAIASYAGGMDAGEAAHVLGVSPDAPPDEVNRAWRLWVRIAHPDIGGDRADFERLQAARRVLLAQAPPQRSVGTSDVIRPTRRQALRDVLQRPRHILLLVLTLIAVIALAVLPGVVPNLPFIVSFAPAAITAAVWASLAQRAMLVRQADRGHRIVVLSALWLPVWLVQLAIAIVLGRDPISILPLTAAPYAAAVAVINAGAGLWRPIRQPNLGETSPRH